MSPWTLVLVVQASMLAVDGENYAAAHGKVLRTGQPMVVMVGAEWCPACKTMEQTVLPEIRRRGLFRKVAFAMVDMDHDSRLGTKLTDGGSIPQIIMYRKTSTGWMRKRLVGRQSVRTVQTFIDEGVRLNAAANPKARSVDIKTTVAATAKTQQRTAPSTKRPTASSTKRPTASTTKRPTASTTKRQTTSTVPPRTASLPKQQTTTAARQPIASG